MKIEWLITDVIAVRSPAREESVVLGVTLGFFDRFRAILWSESHFAIWNSPLEPLNFNWDHAMNIEWLRERALEGVTAGSSARLP